MLKENDQPEAADAQQPEQEQLDSNDLARRRVMEYKDDLLNCEHSGDDRADAAAVDHSAQILEQWETTKNPMARRSLLEGVGREMMMVHEAPPGPINVKEMPRNELGAYHDEDFRTDVNDWQVKQDDPRDALVTYLHEYRHAEQHYEVLKSHGFGRKSVDLERSSAIEFNENHYIRPEDDQAAYERQLEETDAERFGTTTTNEILERRDELRAADKSNSPVTSDGDAIADRRLAAERSSRKG